MEARLRRISCFFRFCRSRSDAAADIVLFFFFLDFLADLAAGCTGGAQDKALDGAHEPDRGAHGRTDGKQHRKQQQQRRVILGQPRGIFPVGERSP